MFWFCVISLCCSPIKTRWRWGRRLLFLSRFHCCLSVQVARCIVFATLVVLVFCFPVCLFVCLFASVWQLRVFFFFPHCSHLRAQVDNPFFPVLLILTTIERESTKFTSLREATSDMPEMLLSFLLPAFAWARQLTSREKKGKRQRSVLRSINSTCVSSFYSRCFYSCKSWRPLLNLTTSNASFFLLTSRSNFFCFRCTLISHPWKLG